MIATKRQRRGHCWIAVWAVFALLLNQQTALAHTCMDVALAAPSAFVHKHSGASHTIDGASAEATMACPHDETSATAACMVHCADVAKDSQHAEAPGVPAFVGVDFWPLNARLEAAMVPRVRGVAVVRNPYKRRLYEFCTLLI